MTVVRWNQLEKALSARREVFIEFSGQWGAPKTGRVRTDINKTILNSARLT